jgi:acyl-CoA thioesterase
MSEQHTPASIAEHILNNDRFSQWLGVKILSCETGYSKISMLIREEMVNGLGIVHGGVTFALADSAFAFACNSYNRRSVALDTSINFIKPAHIGDELIAEAKEVHNGKSTGLYQIAVFNQKKEQIALFKGLCFRTDHPVR